MSRRGRDDFPESIGQHGYAAPRGRETEMQRLRRIAEAHRRYRQSSQSQGEQGSAYDMRRGRDMNPKHKTWLIAAAIGAGAIFLLTRKSAAQVSPAPPLPPPAPPPGPPPPPPPLKTFTRLDVATSANRAPGPQSFTPLKVGDVVSVEGDASTFSMSFTPGMLKRMDGSEGMGPVGLNDFLIVGPGQMFISYSGGSATVLATN